MRNARLDEAQAGVKIAGRNINNLRYEDDTTLRKVKEESIELEREHNLGGRGRTGEMISDHLFPEEVIGVSIMR